MAQNNTESGRWFHQTAISTAEVSRDGTIDPDRNGTFKAKIKAIGDAETLISYVSPFATNGEGGFIAMPTPGVEILVCKPAGSSSWYYLGSTFTPEPLQGEVEGTGGTPPDAEIKPMLRVDPQMYRAKGTPMRQVFKGADGGGLTISQEQNEKFMNKKVELTSAIRKKVSLIDSRDEDAIIIDSGNNSKITLTSDPAKEHEGAKAMPAQMVQIETNGPQKYLNYESQTDMVVLRGGRELQILNYANGEEAEPEKGGNVNIQSCWKDVNIFTQAEAGRIFIECLHEDGDNQVIQIQTNGDTGDGINIITPGNVSISAKNIGISAEDDINMKAGGVINIEADGDLSLKAGGTVWSDGGPDIRLNEGGSSPASPSIGSAESTYENEGITTYPN